MKNKPQSLPDPMLPEHQLIRDAASLPQLSSGLRQQVMASCGQEIRLARWKSRATAGGVVVIVCCLLFMVAVRQPVPPDQMTQEATPTGSQGPQEFHPEVSPGGSPGYESPDQDSTSRDLPVAEQMHFRAPRSPVERQRQETQAPQEQRQINFLMEELRMRQKKLCGALPVF
ncbi:MAG: hypothetical protein KDA91_02385 [Planctomycetaceae bacterium]|nr:hypothetical protein [Planctomycetaceae bacterium]